MITNTIKYVRKQRMIKRLEFDDIKEVARNHGMSVKEVKRIIK